MMNQKDMLHERLMGLAMSGSVEELTKILIRLSVQKTENLSILNYQVPSDNGRTILHAVILNELEINVKIAVIKVLLDFGALFNISDNYGKSVDDYIEDMEKSYFSYKMQIELRVLIANTEEELVDCSKEFEQLINKARSIQLMMVVLHNARQTRIASVENNAEKFVKIVGGEARIDPKQINASVKSTNVYVRRLESEMFPEIKKLFTNIDEKCATLCNSLQISQNVANIDIPFVEYMKHVSYEPLGSYKILHTCKNVICHFLTGYVKAPLLLFVGEAIIHTKYLNNLAIYRINEIISLCEKTKPLYRDTRCDKSISDFIKHISRLSVEIERSYNLIVESIEKINLCRSVGGFSTFLDSYIDKQNLKNFFISNVMQVYIARSIKQEIAMDYQYKPTEYRDVADRYFANLEEGSLQSLQVEFNESLKLYNVAKDVISFKEYVANENAKFIDKISSTPVDFVTSYADMIKIDTEVPSLIAIYVRGQQTLKLFTAINTEMANVCKETIEGTLLPVKEEYIDNTEQRQQKEQVEMQRGFERMRLELGQEVLKQREENKKQEAQLQLYQAQQERQQVIITKQQAQAAEQQDLFIEYSAKFATLNKAHLQTLLDICTVDTVNSIENIALARLLKEVDVNCATLNLSKLPNQLNFTFVGMPNNVHFRHGRDNADYVDGNCIAGLRDRLLFIGFNVDYFVSLLYKNSNDTNGCYVLS